MFIQTIVNTITRKTVKANAAVATPVYEEITIPSLEEALEVLEPLALAGDEIAQDYIAFIEAMVEYEISQFENAAAAELAAYEAELAREFHNAQYSAAVNDWLYNDAYRGTGW